MAGNVFLRQKRSAPRSFGAREKILVGLTSLRTSNPPMLPKLNRKRAVFVLTKIDEILAWEKQCETERDTRLFLFVDQAL